jgi:hypothetical protein
VAALTMGHIQHRDGRWCIIDLLGKHGRVRTIPMPVWVKVAIDAWTFRAGVVDDYVFRPVNRGDQVAGEVLSEKVVWQLLRLLRPGDREGLSISWICDMIDAVRIRLRASRGRGSRPL